MPSSSLLSPRLLEQRFFNLILLLFRFLSNFKKQSQGPLGVFTDLTRVITTGALDWSSRR